MVHHRLLIIATLALLSACGRLLPAGHQQTDPIQLEAGAFALDPDHAALIWKIDHLGFSTFVGRFNAFDASLDFDPDDPSASSLDVVVQTASVDSGVGELDEILRGAGWFNTQAFPEARFVAREITVTGDASGTITGDLTLLGTTRPITLDVAFNGGADDFLTGRYTLGFAATGSFDRTAFGLDNLAPAVGEQVELEIHVEFKAREDA